MCGIAGIINFNLKPVQESNIRIMMQEMKHRGPDDDGVFIDNNIGLGFVRLSILDLSSAGHQPMFSHNKRFVIIFNGEVYNYIEIREELKVDFKFKTGTDTEVVLAAYQKWGEKCLDKFNGMFAFVIYDTQAKTVFGARDRYGIKPFYYYHDDSKFIFASEIKSILPFIEKKANDKAIYDYLLFNRTDLNEHTFFAGVKKLQHGSSFTIINNAFCHRKWYNLLEKKTIEKELSPTQYKELFKDALKLRMRSDVPVGVSLSGGIDSSSIVASLVKDFSLSELNTFSAVFGKEEDTDESEFVDEFKDIVENLHFTFPNADSFFQDFRDLIKSHSEPIPDPGPYIQYKVMELASKHVKVTIDGQGADEQLAGYHYFFGSYFRELINEFKFKRLISENFNYVKNHHSLNAIKYLIYYLLPTKVQILANRSIFQSINKAFLKANYKKSTINIDLFDPKSLNESLFQHFENKLEHLLKWEDLNSMSFSIEARVPFLDYRLVEATLNTPSNQKIYKGETKHLLREALKDILPQKIANRKDKKGFSNPASKWFRDKKFNDYIITLIQSPTFASRGYFNSEKAQKQFLNHQKGKADNSKEIWKWINLELWFREYIDK
jgi:asparagine synthase (glutamine-hydrolysing)